VTFPDPAGLVIGYLEPLVAPVHVGSRVPKPRPDRFIQVRRVGGRSETVRDIARLDIFCWDPTDPGAMALALDVRTRIWALAGSALLGPAVYRVAEFLAPRHSDDDKTGTPRVWATYELAVRADDAIHRAPTP